MTEIAPAFQPTNGRVKVANEVIAQIAAMTATFWLTLCDTLRPLKV